MDASTRFLSRSKMIRKWRLMELAWTVLLTWVIVFLIFRHDLIKAVVAASATALIAALLVHLFQPRIIKRRIRTHVKETHADENEFPCEVELTPAAVLIREGATQTVLEWPKVAEISVTSDSVDIFGRTGGVIVRDRAFTSPDEKREFVRVAQNYLAVAGLNAK